MCRSRRKVVELPSRFLSAIAKYRACIKKPRVRVPYKKVKRVKKPSRRRVEYSPEMVKLIQYRLREQSRQSKG